MPTPEEIIAEHRGERGFYIIRRPDGTIREIGASSKVYYTKGGISAPTPPSPPKGEISLPPRHAAPAPPRRVIIAPPPKVVPKPGVEQAIVRQKEAIKREVEKIKKPLPRGFAADYPGVAAGRQTLRGLILAPAAAKETIKYAYKHPKETAIGIAAFAGLSTVSPALPVAAIGGLAAYEIAKGRPEYAVSDVLIAGAIGKGMGKAVTIARTSKLKAGTIISKISKPKILKKAVKAPGKPARDLPAALRPGRLKVSPELGTFEDFRLAYPKYKPKPPKEPATITRMKEAVKKRLKSKPGELTEVFKKAEIRLVQESISKSIKRPILRPIDTKVPAAPKKIRPTKKPSPFEPKPPEVKMYRTKKGQVLIQEQKIKLQRPTKLKPRIERQLLLPVLIQDPTQAEKEAQDQALGVRLIDGIEEKEKEKEKPGEILRTFLDVPESELFEDIAGTLTLVGGITLLDGGIRRPPRKPPKGRGFGLPLGGGGMIDLFQPVRKAKRRPAEYVPSIVGLISGKRIKRAPKRITGLEVRYPVGKKRTKRKKPGVKEWITI